jgi:diguanylate cyclase (GGDEF)-like protein
MLARTRGNALEEVVAEQEQEIVDLRAKAALDGLTNVCNRRTFDVYLPQAVNRSHRVQLAVSLAIFDLDDFKKFNDENSTSVGDLVLKAFAHHLMANVRSDDAVFRIGGEKFAVMLMGAEESLALSTVEGIRAEFSLKTFKREGSEPVSVKASAGIAHCSRTESHKDLYSRADRALLSSKRNGKDQTSEAPSKG